MENSCEKIEYKGCTIVACYDCDNPMNPRLDYDNFGHMVCFHGRYVLGDKFDGDQDDLKRIISREDIHALPLYLYDHSGITMRTYPFSDIDPGCWDSGLVGYIYISEAEIEKEYGRVDADNVKKAMAILRNEVDIYNCYIGGEVYGFFATDKEGEDIDSCWGFMGKDGFDYMIEEAKASIDSYVETAEKRLAIDIERDAVMTQYCY